MRLRDVARRHGFYAAAFALVLRNDPESQPLTAALLWALVLLVHADSRTPLLFFALVGVIFPLLEALAIAHGKNTWSYDSTSGTLPIPLWLFPLWALAGQWVLDARGAVARVFR